MNKRNSSEVSSKSFVDIAKQPQSIAPPSNIGTGVSRGVPTSGEAAAEKFLEKVTPTSHTPKPTPSKPTPPKVVHSNRKPKPLPSKTIIAPRNAQFTGQKITITQLPKLTNERIIAQNQKILAAINARRNKALFFGDKGAANVLGKKYNDIATQSNQALKDIQKGNKNPKEQMITVGNVTLSTSQVKNKVYDFMPLNKDIRNAFEHVRTSLILAPVRNVQQLQTDVLLEKEVAKEKKFQQQLKSLPKAVQDTTWKLVSKGQKWTAQTKKRFDFIKKILDVASKDTFGKPSGKIGDMIATTVVYLDPSVTLKQLGQGFATYVWLQRLKKNYPFMRKEIKAQNKAARIATWKAEKAALKNPMTYIIPLIPAVFKGISSGVAGEEEAGIAAGSIERGLGLKYLRESGEKLPASVTRKLLKGTIKKIPKSVARKAIKGKKGVSLTRSIGKLIRAEWKDSDIYKGIRRDSRVVSNFVRKLGITKDDFIKALKVERSKIKARLTKVKTPKKMKFRRPSKPAYRTVKGRLKLSKDIAKASLKVRIKQAKIYVREELSTLRNAFNRDRKVVSNLVSDFRLSVKKASKIVLDRIRSLMRKNSKTLTKDQELKYLERARRYKRKMGLKFMKDKEKSYLKRIKEKATKEKILKKFKREPSLSKKQELKLVKESRALQSKIKQIERNVLEKERKIIRKQEFDDIVNKATKYYFKKKSERVKISLPKGSRLNAYVKRLVDRIGNKQFDMIRKRIMRKFEKATAKRLKAKDKAFLKEYTPSVKFSIKKYVADMKKELVSKIQNRIKILEAKTPKKIVKPKRIKKASYDTTVEIKGQKYEGVKYPDGSGEIFIDREIPYSDGTKMVIRDSFKRIPKSRVTKTFSKIASKLALKRFVVGAITGSLAVTSAKSIVSKSKAKPKISQSITPKRKIKVSRKSSQKRGQKKGEKVSQIPKIKTSTTSISKSGTTTKISQGVSRIQSLGRRQSVDISEVLSKDQFNRLKDKLKKKSLKINIPIPKFKRVKSRSNGYLVGILYPSGLKVVDKLVLSKSDARKLGRFIVDNTIKASFKPVPVKRLINYKMTLKYVDQRKFRNTKSRSVKRRGLRVEKRKYRIDSLGEKAGLSAARLTNRIGLNLVSKRRSVSKSKKKPVKKRSVKRASIKQKKPIKKSNSKSKKKRSKKTSRRKR